MATLVLKRRNSNRAFGGFIRAKVSLPAILCRSYVISLILIVFFYIDTYFRLSDLPSAIRLPPGADPVAAFAILTTSIALGSRMNL